MDTLHVVVDRDRPDEALLAEPAAVLRRGGLVAFPTETVYGLGANALDPEAASRIYAAKGRPSDNPLIVHIAALDEINALVRSIPANARALMERFWPGPLTLVMERTPAVPNRVTGGLNTVAVRFPDCPVAQKLIALSGVPVAAPSANLSGRPSPTNAADVLADMAGRIEVVVDSGPCVIGVESTVVDCTTPVPTLLRPGGITMEMLTEVLGVVETDPALNGSAVVPRSPGMKYRHYAPKAPLILLEGSPERIAAVMLEKVHDDLAAGRRVGAAVSQELAEVLPAAVTSVGYGPVGDTAAAAASLFTVLRSFDSYPLDVIYAEGMAETDLGLAVMNRLRKAAGYRIIYC